MKDLFPAYYAATAEDLDWDADDIVVAFDANVLLNLYRYPAEASNDVLAVMQALGSKSWLPHQAALEYQRHRLPIIAEQKKRFGQVRQVVDKAISSLSKELSKEFGKLQLEKRHSTIDPTLPNRYGRFKPCLRASVRRRIKSCRGWI